MPFNRKVLAMGLTISLQACVSAGGAALQPGENAAISVNDPSINDPYEGFNRRMFAVNNTLDRNILKPVAKGYRSLPDPVERGIENFLANLISPVTLVNDILQGELSRASTTATRLAINTTIGLGGFFDPARELGYTAHTEDFGQTLAVYGVDEGPYLFIPIMGPLPPRDLLGTSVDTFFDPVTWIYADDGLAAPLARYAIDGIASRASALEILDEIERTSVDYYATIRSLYRQNRKSEIANGETDLDDLPDLDALDDLDDFEEFDDFEN